MRALVTGAGGFVGHHLVAHLEACDDDVTGVDRECDVTDASSLRSAVAAARPDVIYHLAALTHVGDSWQHPVEYTRVNVLGTTNVLDVAHREVPGATVVVVSSADVYGVVTPDDLPIAETFRVAPANPYSSSKVEAEHAAREAVRTRSQRVVIARPFNHIGPGQATTFVLPAIVNRLLDASESGARRISVGDLSARRDFSDVRDVVRAYRLLAKHGLDGDVYNVATGHDVALVELVERLIDELAPGVRTETDPELLRPVEIPVLRGSFEKLHEATGWEPSISLDETLADVVADLRSRRSSR